MAALESQPCCLHSKGSLLHLYLGALTRARPIRTVPIQELSIPRGWGTLQGGTPNAPGDSWTKKVAIIPASLLQSLELTMIPSLANVASMGNVAWNVLEQLQSQAWKMLMC